MIHYSDVVYGSIVEKIFNDLKIENRIKELDSKSKNPCSRISFLSCFPKSAEASVRGYLRKSNIDSLSALVMGLALPNEKITNNENPDKEGTNAKMWLILARKRAQEIAKTELCNCSCDCPEVKIRVQLYGGHWLTPEKRAATPEPAQFIQYFYTGGSRWNPLFSDITKPCDANPSRN